jgi:hypothetical protein
MNRRLPAVAPRSDQALGLMPSLDVHIERAEGLIAA